MPDLALALKYNPQLKMLVVGGYYDLATPYYEVGSRCTTCRSRKACKKNIEYKYFPSGHMVYAHQESSNGLHAAAADFIYRTDNLSK